MKILKFNVFEKLEPEWFDKNPDFYLSKGRENIKKDVDYHQGINKTKENIGKLLKKIDVNDIKWEKDDNDYYTTIKPESIKDVYKFVYRASDDEYNFYGGGRDLISHNHYKIILSFVNYINQKSIIINGIEKIIITDLFLNSDYYGLVYKKYSIDLFLTKNKNEYFEKIKELKLDSYIKIIYHNSKIKGKELIDYKNIDKQKIRHRLKDVKYTDIYFNKTMDKYDRDNYSVQLRDKELYNASKKLDIFRSFRFTSDNSKSYFGQLKNRFHAGNIDSTVRGMGLGHKIYKAFLKKIGYIVSDDQSSYAAQNIYIKLLKDNDVYHVINEEENKVMLIWKNYPKIEELMIIVKKEEEKTNKKFIYDDELLKYIE